MRVKPRTPKANAPFPELIPPCLPTLVKKPPSGPEWLHEVKWDGYRFVCYLKAGNVRMMTRNALDWSSNFPAIVEAIQKLPAGAAIIDGEAVILDDSGVSHFGSLQQAFAKGGGKARNAVLYAFDLLYLDGLDLRREPLVTRKAELARLLKRVGRNSAVQLSEELEGDAKVILKAACREGLEGIVSKRRDSPYPSGRSKEWLKTKCVLSDEFIIIGFTPSDTKKGGLGALRVATKARGKLRYAGGVGTGFSAEVGQELLRRLEKMRIDKPPIPGLREPGTVWIRPELLAEIDFRGWTEEKLLRHPSFKGLREDK
jgi:bifunctional non-homologous end joining protein LigD